MKNVFSEEAGCPLISIMGTTVMGERGQVVIPKEVRDNLGLEAGSRIIVMQHEFGAIALVPAEKMRTVLEGMGRHITETLKTLNV